MTGRISSVPAYRRPPGLETRRSSVMTLRSVASKNKEKAMLIIVEIVRRLLRNKFFPTNFKYFMAYLIYQIFDNY